MIKVNSKVAWKWLGREIEGIVREIYYEKTVQTIKGKRITRNGSKDNPAYLVESKAGNLALKLGTELKTEPNSKKSVKKKTPSMFSD